MTAPSAAGTGAQAAPVLATGLFDDAALFPPGDAPMAAAVPAHRDLRERLGDLVGPFVVPAARLGELSAHLGDGEPIDVSLIAATGDLPAAAARVGAHPGLTLAAVEVPVATDVAAAREAVRVLDDVLPAGVPAAVELPRSAARDEVLDVLADTRYRAKLRTGGVRAPLFPSPSELAGTLHACVTRDVAFKCTAGLHHAVRHTDPATGFEHHGFLNVLLAASALASGAPPTVATEWLAATDPGTVATAVRTWPAARATRARAAFTSFGTCSVLEPVEDLVALGLLPAPERISA
ncbi:hypothetical protein SAMN05660209_00990 [Geodermatophilus africanus]|uniref:Uncharacterized protein n=1 Tax=Geodermatophilus africanus TaxID=1137993 RepID=A0A1H3DH16_9ACTN|nr:hypothetical protein [Geodermatophilus africanus]SDX65661.1 hypothetical protein SAMN05660209_00990 [Geodermatophilus africanus]